MTNRTFCKGAIAAAFGNRVLQVARQTGFSIERAAASVAIELEQTTLERHQEAALNNPFSPKRAVISRLRDAAKLGKQAPLSSVLAGLAGRMTLDSRRQEVVNG